MVRLTWSVLAERGWCQSRFVAVAATESSSATASSLEMSKLPTLCSNSVSQLLAERGLVDAFANKKLDCNYCCFKIGAHAQEATAAASDPWSRFLSLLPPGRTVDRETERIILVRFGMMLLGVYSRDVAVDLLELAQRYPHRSTATRLETDADLIIEEEAEAGAASASLLRAFDATTGRPKVIKLSQDPQREMDAYSLLALQPDEATALHIVPIDLVTDAHSTRHDPRQLLVMPSYHCALSSMPHAPPALVLRGVRQIRRALHHFHSKGVFHMDVKPANILIDGEGGWHLTDYDSCVIAASNGHDAPGPPPRLKLTTNFIPRDLPLIPSAAFDHALLVVTAIFMLDRDALNLRSGFTLSRMRSFVDELEDEDLELKELLIELLPTTTQA